MAHGRARKQIIEFNAVQSDVARDDVEAAEAEKRLARAAKYGTQNVVPPEYLKSQQSARQGSRAAHADGRTRRPAPPRQEPGFTTGLEIFSEEEASKRAARAARFNTAHEPDVADGLKVRVAKPTQEQLATRAELKGRAERFGMDYKPDDTGLMDVDLLEQRAEVDRSVDRRPDTIHVYGVDLMSTKDVKTYFKQYSPRFVEWINDSSCNVCFDDTVAACRAIVGLGEALAADEAPDQGGLGIDDVDISQAAYMWHRSHTAFVKGGVVIPLVFRIATILDVKDPTAKQRSRYLWKAATGGEHAHPQKRAREDADGDVVMDEEDGAVQRRRRGKAHKSFLQDDDVRQPVTDTDLLAIDPQHLDATDIEAQNASTNSMDATAAS